MYFLELLVNVYPSENIEIKKIHSETNEIVAIIVASINKTRNKIK